MPEIAALKSDRWYDLIHRILLVSLVVWRPLMGGIPPELDHAVWMLLPLAGLALCTWELFQGRREGIRLSLRALALAIPLLLLLVFAALRASEQMQAWRAWTALAGIGLAALYAQQVIGGRERLMLGALATSLTILLTCAFVQYGYVFPLLQERAKQGAFFGFAGSLQQAITNRLQTGGIYGPYTLANGLAVALALLSLPLLSALWASRKISWSAAVLVLLLIASVLAWWMTGAKGIIAGGLLATGIIVLRRLSWRWRLISLGVGIPLIAALVLHPPQGIRASAEVRIAYTKAATSLIMKSPFTGLGTRAYEHLAPSQLQPEDERSSFAHNSWLEIACSAGLPAALLAAMLMLGWMLLPLHSKKPVKSWNAEDAQPLLIVPLIMLYAVLCGTLLSDNLIFWPGVKAESPLVMTMVWGALLGLLGGAVGAVATRLSPPPPWVLLITLGAFCLSTLLDFHLEETSLVGLALLIAAWIGSQDGNHRLVKRGAVVMSTCLTLGCLLVIVAGFALTYLHSSRESALGECSWLRKELTYIEMKRKENLSEKDSRHLRERATTFKKNLDQSLEAGYRLMQIWPQDLRQWTDLMLIDPDITRHNLQMDKLLATGRTRPVTWQAAGLFAVEQERWDDAVNAAERYSAYYRWNLQRRVELLKILRLAQDKDPDPKKREYWKERAEEIRMGIIEDDPKVGYQNHLSKPIDVLDPPRKPDAATTPLLRGAGSDNR